MRRSLLVLLFAVPFSALAQPLPADVVANVEARVEAGENEGVFVGVVGPEGTRTASFGRLAADRAEAPDAATLFEIGSVTKVLTALLLVEMVEHGEVILDDPIASYLPDTLDVAFGDRVTLEHLATHTSGLPRLPTNLVFEDPTDPYAAYSAEDLYAFLEGHRLEREPGARYEYSNLGMGLLGHLLARRAGTTYEALLRERVLDPLGLDDTAVTLSTEQQARLAPGHSDGRRTANWTFDALGGAGALRSTGADMLRFVGAALGLVETPLADDLAALQEVRGPGGEDSVAVALGWHVRTTPNATVTAHGGGTGGYRSFVGFDPAARRGVVVLTNSDADLQDVAYHLLDPAVPLVPPVETADVPADVLARYVGTYALAPDFVIVVTREGERLYAQATGQQAFRLYPSSETEFFLRPVEARVTFRVGEAGTVEGLTLHQNGRDMPAVKTE